MALNLKMYQAVEIPINSTSLTRFYYQDQPQLRNAAINAIELYSANTISATPLTGSTPTASADVKKASLVLYSGDLQVVWNIPLFSLNRISNGTDPYVFELPSVQGIVISWVKSYVQFATAPSSSTTALAFGVYYTLPTM